MALDIDREMKELQGVFPDINRGDFYDLDNGNIGTVLYYDTTSRTVNDFKILMEFPPGYPDMPPKGWVMKPKLRDDTPHIWGKEDGQPMICFIDPDDWSSRLTSYDAAVMIKTWVYAYCNWVKTGNWTWDEKAHDTPDSSVFDLLPF